MYLSLLVQRKNLAAQVFPVEPQCLLVQLVRYILVFLDDLVFLKFQVHAVIVVLALKVYFHLGGHLSVVSILDLVLVKMYQFDYNQIA